MMISLAPGVKKNEVIDALRRLSLKAYERECGSMKALALKESFQPSSG